MNKLTRAQVSFKVQQILIIKEGIHCIMKERKFDDVSKEEQDAVQDLRNVTSIIAYDLKDSLELIGNEINVDEVSYLVNWYETYVMPYSQLNYDKDK